MFLPNINGNLGYDLFRMEFTTSYVVAGFNPGEKYAGRWRSSSYFYGLNMHKHNNMWNHVKPPIRYIYIYKHKQQMGCLILMYFDQKLRDTLSNPQTGSLLMLSD